MATSRLGSSRRSSASTTKRQITSASTSAPDRAEALRASRLPLAAAARAAERANALADPTGLALASALGETDELYVCDLAWIAERSQTLVSHHLRSLRAAGLVAGRRDGKMVMYALTDQGRSLLRAVLDLDIPATR